MEVDFIKHRSCLNDYVSIVYNVLKKNNTSTDDYSLVCQVVRDNNREATVHVVEFSDGHQRY